MVRIVVTVKDVVKGGQSGTSIFSEFETRDDESDHEKQLSDLVRVALDSVNSFLNHRDRKGMTIHGESLESRVGKALRQKFGS